MARKSNVNKSKAGVKTTLVLDDPRCPNPMVFLVPISSILRPISSLQSSHTLAHSSHQLLRVAANRIDGLPKITQVRRLQIHVLDRTVHN